MHLMYLLVGVAHQDDLWRDVLGRATDGLHLALFHLLGQPKVGDLDARDVVSIRRPLQQKILQLEITPTHLSSAGSQSNHLFFIRCSAPAPQLAASCGFSIHLYSNLQAFMHAVQPCPYMKVSLPEYAGQAGRSSLQGSNALCVQVLDAPQQLDKAVARISFIVAATLQHCIQKLPSSQQLCYQVHLRSVHVLLSHSNAFNGLRHDTQALDSRQSRKASQHMHAPNNLRVGM
jgi:hypothetical protein